MKFKNILKASEEKKSGFFAIINLLGFFQVNKKLPKILPDQYFLFEFLFHSELKKNGHN